MTDSVIAKNVPKFNTVRKGLAKLSARQVVLLLLLLFSAITAWSLSPLLGNNGLEDADTRFQKTISYPSIIERAQVAADLGNENFEDTGSILVTPLVRLDYRVYTLAGDEIITPVAGSEEGAVTRKTPIRLVSRAEMAFDFESATIFFGLSAIVLFSAYFVVSQANENGIAREDARQPIDGAPPQLDIFQESADFARSRTTSIYSRATYLLISGVLMAFIGIGVFYFALTDELTRANEYFRYQSLLFDLGDEMQRYRESDLDPEILARLEAQLANVNSNFSEDAIAKQRLDLYLGILRAVGILFFIEAVAWFLLRQYRQLVDDHKWAFAQYLRRQNIQAADKITQGSTEGKMALLASILEEDHSGKLVAGETTESLENARTVQHNPVFDLMTKLIEKGVPTEK